MESRRIRPDDTVLNYQVNTPRLYAIAENIPIGVNERL